MPRTDRIGNTVSCTYDKAGNLKTETDALGNQTTALNRLTKEATTNSDGTTNRTAYQYDEGGNRIRKTEDGVMTEYTYNNLNQLIEEKTGDLIQGYAYDVNGNLICKGTETDFTTYTYSLENQLEQAVTLDNGVEQVESYTYDAEGNRLSKTETKKKPDTVDENGKTVKGEVLETDTTYFVMDTLNEYAQVSLELDEKKEVKTAYIRGDGLISQQKYNKEGDEEGSQQTGSFISMDTYQGNAYDPASLHKYTYAQNNPEMYSDPSGHFIGVIGSSISTACRSDR